MAKIIKKDQVEKDLSLGDRLEMDRNRDVDLSGDQKVISRDDLGVMQKGKKIIEEAMGKAKIIKDEAKTLYLQVEEKMEEARKQGFEKGRQEGLASVTEQLVGIRNQNQKLLEKIEREAVSLVHDIASRVIGDTLRTSDEALMGMVRQSLQSSMGSELVIYLNPADLERIKKNEAQLMAHVQGVRTLTIKSHENVQPGGCMIESELGTIDAQLDYQMEAIRKALTEE